jgi:hypothetical protein
MKDTIEKDKRRNISLQDNYNYHDSWRLSHKYSSMLMNHIENENYYELSWMYYSQFMNELHQQKYNKDRNYVQVWETMINTGSRDSIRLLHQTSVQRSN